MKIYTMRDINNSKSIQPPTVKLTDITPKTIEKTINNIKLPKKLINVFAAINTNKTL